MLVAYLLNVLYVWIVGLLFSVLGWCVWIISCRRWKKVSFVTFVALEYILFGCLIFVVGITLVALIRALYNLCYYDPSDHKSMKLYWVVMNKMISSCIRLWLWSLNETAAKYNLPCLHGSITITSWRFSKALISFQELIKG